MDDTRLPLEWNEQRQRLGFASSALGQREFGLSGRDCRTTKMRERDTRAAIAANAAQIRLGVKSIIARLPQSPGTSGRICKAEKSKTQAKKLAKQRPQDNMFAVAAAPKKR